MSLRLFAALALGLASSPFAARQATAAEPVDFARDVRPILSRSCFKCHGPDDDKRQAGLRLDLRDIATKPAESGERAIVPGDLKHSELLARINSDDNDTVMPPPETKQTLTAAQKDILRQWIAEGAEYKPHWAFIAPTRPALPAVKQADWPHNAIDRFVLARLEKESLAPSPVADRHTLARRASLDLIGLPPTPAQTQAFVDDARPDAYERYVDALLASPAYGERWARKWLDLARYADTNGYEKDRVRSIWPYRDWVIRALNRDMPYDQFTIEQLAGDMLPHATLDQKIATGFHRNTMLNEEGGIDPLEFRYYSVVDRINTTATTWLGLTLGCAQCHTHKFDPVPHREYYAMMAYLNNCDEPEMPVPQPELAARRQQLLDQIADHEAALPDKFSADEKLDFVVAKPSKAAATSGAKLEARDDGSVFVTGNTPAEDTYAVQFSGEVKDVAGLKLEALVDDALPSTGPGRTPHGNFVLSEIKVSVAPAANPDQQTAVKIASATADFEQTDFTAAGALDGDPKTGWAINGTGKWNVNRAATFVLEKPVTAKADDVWTVELVQRYGTQHVLGKFRISLGSAPPGERPLAERRREQFEQKFTAWQTETAKQAVRWTVLKPIQATSNSPLLTILDDHSILSSGDQTKSDLYTIKLANAPRFTALRLEALADERLPQSGPGRIYYEGPAGDFFLSQITATATQSPLKFAKAVHSFASGGNTADKAIDSDLQSGWSVNGGQGESHSAIFVLDQTSPEAAELEVKLLFERYYAAGLGRFRLSVTDDPRALENVSLPASVNDALLIPAAQRSPQHTVRLRKHFLKVAPELAGARTTIDQLRKQLPQFPTTLAMSERPRTNPRPTFRMHRGEFLQPKEEVAANTLSAVGPPLPFEEHNRLTFAKWLVHPNNVLTGRVTVNRHWAAFFGRGLVRTTEDFGLQGELPTHPELLDWLAIEFVEQGWSVKDLHRLMVTSSTYRQASRVTPELAQRDPQNVLLTRGPRVRLEAEQLRDYALAVSGLLSTKQGGPSVFPPQPASVTSEGAYGALAWNVSTGEDRYRRGLYTFAKRTTPFAMSLTFDAPSGEACLPRREVSNTPLQALVLLNDEVFVEAAQTLARSITVMPSDDGAKASATFERILMRPPTSTERERLGAFVTAQRERVTKKEIDAAALAGAGDNAAERAVWTLLARALLNLDETVTKE
jgi:hypothetical protein